MDGVRGQGQAGGIGSNKATSAEKEVRFMGSDDRRNGIVHPAKSQNP